MIEKNLSYELAKFPQININVFILRQTFKCFIEG